MAAHCPQVVHSEVKSCLKDSVDVILPGLANRFGHSSAPASRSYFRSVVYHITDRDKENTHPVVMEKRKFPFPGSRVHFGKTQAVVLKNL